jgi:hypothetical protein
MGGGHIKISEYATGVGCDRLRRQIVNCDSENAMGVRFRAFLFNRDRDWVDTDDPRR